MRNIKLEKLFRDIFKKDYKKYHKRRVRRVFKNTNKEFSKGNWYKKLIPFYLYDYC